LVKKTKPRESKPLSRTVRADGAPDASAVASVMALSSMIPASIATSSQAANCSIGSAASSSSDSPCAAYSLRSRASRAAIVSATGPTSRRT
jgi:hypothetical protein